MTQPPNDVISFKQFEYCVCAEFLNPIPRDELMEESGLFSIEDPFNSEMEDPHQNNQCQIQVVSYFFLSIGVFLKIRFVKVKCF
jgi:hypothetical protein